MVKSIEEMEEVARDFLAEVTFTQNTATVFGLYGELGAGKTTFTQSFARALGVKERVVSPTFVIEKIYELPSVEQSSKHTFTHLIHIDAYRIEHSDELLHLGWKEITANSHNLIVIEWPERVADIMPPHIRIDFMHVSEKERKVKIQSL